MDIDREASSVRRRVIALIVGSLICAVAILVVRVRFAGPEGARGGSFEGMKNGWVDVAWMVLWFVISMPFRREIFSSLGKYTLLTLFTHQYELAMCG